MPPTYADLIASARSSVRAVGLEEIKRRLESREPMVLVDVRDKDELRVGALPGALHIPRGSLELQVERKIPDKSAPLVVYCASGARSVLAAKTLGELGYTRVESADPGFSRWKELGYPLGSTSTMSDAQLERYGRHLLLPEVGEAGQSKLLDARVLVLGVGGLGSPAALYLSAAGVGTIGLCDADVVDPSNLHRQIAHAQSRVGRRKVDSAESAIRDLNPEVRVVKIAERLTSSNVDRIFDGFDVVIDGCDNYPTRYLVNDASVLLGKPVAHGSIHRFEGQVTTFVPGSGGPCYRCLYPLPPPRDVAPSCEEAGVLGVLPGLIGVLQATETIKLLLGQGTALSGRLLTYDAMLMRFVELKVPRDPGCPACGDAPTITGYVDYEAFCAR